MSTRKEKAESLIRAAYAAAFPDGNMVEGKKTLLVAIDGRCASGKSTLAAELAVALSDIGCAVVHMDDFFLRPAQRTPERLACPGENVDHERFREEILEPVSLGRHFWYVPYSCRTGRLVTPVAIDPPPILIAEGSYSCHPHLRDCYDLRFFLSVDKETQMARIRARNGEESAEIFRTRWIPLEEAYFAACRPADVSVSLD